MESRNTNQQGRQRARPSGREARVPQREKRDEVDLDHTVLDRRVEFIGCEMMYHELNFRQVPAIAHPSVGSARTAGRKGEGEQRLAHVHKLDYLDNLQARNHD